MFKVFCGDCEKVVKADDLEAYLLSLIGQCGGKIRVVRLPQ